MTLNPRFYLGLGRRANDSSIPTTHSTPFKSFEIFLSYSGCMCVWIDKWLAIFSSITAEANESFDFLSPELAYQWKVKEELMGKEKKKLENSPRNGKIPLEARPVSVPLIAWSWWSMKLRSQAGFKERWNSKLKTFVRRYLVFLSTVWT